MGFLSKLFKPITDFLGDMIGFLTGVDFDDIENQAPAVLVNKQSNVAALPVIYGRRKVGGVRVYIGTGGNKNKYLYIALALCEGEIEAIESIYINDRLIQFDTNGSVLTSRSNSFYKNKIKVQKFLGKDTGQVEGASHTYSTILAEQSEWTSSHKLKGVAYLALRIQHDKDKHGGIPDIKCIVKGRKVYDPRNSTTAYSNNPALCLRDYLTNTRYGKGLPTSAIDDTTGRAGFQTAADSCDDASYTVTPFFGAGTTVHLLECNARLDTNKTIFSNVKEMLQGMRGLMPYSEGKYGLIIDEAYTADSSTFDLSPDNITSDITVQQSGKGKRFNRVIVNFPNPAANWQQDSVMFPEKSTDSNSDYLTFLSEDNDEELVKEVQCNTITSLYAARELARVICLASRKNVNAVKLTATSEALNIAVGDVVRLEHPSMGWTGAARQLMRVSNLQMQDDGEVGLSLVEHNNSIYTFLQGTEEPDNLESTFSGIFDIDAPTGLGASENTIIGGDGSLQPSITASWTASDDEFVQEYEVQWKKSTDTAYQVAFTSEVEFAIAPVEVNYGSPVTYDIRVRAINSANVASDFETTTQQVQGDSTAPSAITLGAITGGVRAITVEWTNPTDDDYAFTEVHVVSTNTTPATNASPTAKVAGEEYIHPTGSGVETKYFFLRAVDFSGNKGAFTGTSNNSGSSVRAATDDIADDAVTITKIADTLQSTNYSQGSAGWKLTTDGTFEAGDGTFRGAVTATSGSFGGTTIASSKIYQGTGTWASSNTGFYLDNTGKFSLKDKLFFSPTDSRLTVSGNITADTITVNDQLVVLGPLEAKSLAAGTITREMLSQDVLDEIFGALATSVGGSNGDYKEGTGSFTTSGGTVTLGTSSDKFDHGTADVDVEFIVDHFFYSTTNYTTAQAQATLNFEVSADGTFTDLTSATKTHTLQFNEYDLSSYYGYTYLVYYLTGDVTKTFTSGSGNDIPDDTDLQFRVRVTGVGTAFTSQTVPFTLEANEGVTGVVSTGGNADTLDNLDSTAFLRSNTNDTFDGDLTVTGQLILQGSIDQYNVTDLDVTDKTITVNAGGTQSLSNGAGLIVDRGTAADASITWDETNDEFDFSHPIKVAGSVGVTNIVTNKIVKFNGTIFDDSNITDTGSAITLGSNTTVSGTLTSGAITATGSSNFTNMNVSGGILVGSYANVGYQVSVSTNRIEYKRDGTSYLDQAGTGNIAFRFGSSYTTGLTLSSSSATFAGTLTSGAITSTTTAATAIVANRSNGGVVIDIQKNGVRSGSIGTQGVNLAINSEGSGGYGRLQDNGSDVAIWWTNGFYPASDNTKNLGVSATSGRWKNLFMANSIYMNGSQIVDASRNLTNIGSITASGTLSSGAITADGGGTQSTIKSSSDAPLIVESTDAFTGILFTDTGGSGYLFYGGANNHLYTHNSKFSVAGSTIASGYEFQVNGSANLIGSLAFGGATAIDVNRNATLHDITTDGVVRSTNNANADGPNFNVSTTNKDTAEYAYRVDRSGTVVGGIRIDGRVNAQTVEVGGTTVISSSRNATFASVDVTGAFTDSAANRGIKFDSTSMKPSNGSGGDADNHIDLGTSSARFKDLYLSGDIYLGGANEQVGTVYRADVTGVNSSSYVTAFTVTGSQLGSSIRATFVGTSSNVVVNVVADILVNHHQDILIQTLSGFYSTLSIKVTSDNNEDFAVEIKHSGSTTTTIKCEVVPLNNEAVTFTSSHSFTGSSHEHSANHGFDISGTGGNTGTLRTAGDLIASNAYVENTLYHQNDTNTYLKFDTDRIRLYAGGNLRFDSDNIYLTSGSVVDLNSTQTISGTKIFNSDIIMGTSSTLRRSNHHMGHLEGSYNDVGNNASKSNPIYTIGSSYNPTDAALSNMYGIGFAKKGDATFLGDFRQSGWGLYIASDGDARVFLNAQTGVVASTSGYDVGAVNVIDSSRNATFEQVTVGSGSSNAGAIYVHDTSTTAYTLGILGTGTRAYKMQGSASSSDYNLTMENAGTGAFNLLVGGDIELNDDAPLIRLEEQASGGSKRLDLSVGTDAIGRISANQSASGLAFETTGSERVRITSTGNIGVGTTAPASALSGSNTNLSIEDAQGSDIKLKRTGGVDLSVGVTSSNTAYLWSSGSYDILFGTAGTERMRLSSGGSVSIGTTTTTGAGGLLVDNDIKTNSRIGVGSVGSTAAPAIYLNSDTDTGIYFPSANQLGLVAGGSRKFYVSSTDAHFQNLSGGVNLPRTIIAHSESSGMKLTATDSTADAQFYGFHIDYNASGSDTTTADRIHSGLYIDADSSASGGGTSHEHRFYGAYITATASGDSDIIDGAFMQGRADNFGAGNQVTYLRGNNAMAVAHHDAGTVANTAGVYGYGQDSSSGSGETHNIYGGFFVAYGASTSSYTSTNFIGARAFAQIGASQSSNIQSAVAVWGEVQLDNDAAADHDVTITSAYCFRAEYDENDADDTYTVNNGYLYYGNYAGTLPNSAWGVYIADDVPNYFAGSIRTGDGSTSTASYGFNGDVNTGMYSPANHELGFLANGTQKLKVNADGITVTGEVRVNSNSNDTSSSMGGQTPKLYVNGYTSLGSLRINGTDTGNTIYKKDSDLSIIVGSNHLLKLGTTGGERVRIDTSGYLRLGGSATNATQKISSVTSTSGSGGAGTGNRLQLEFMETSYPQYGAKVVEFGVRGGGYVNMRYPGSAGLYTYSPYNDNDYIHIGYAGISLVNSHGGYTTNEDLLLRSVNGITFQGGGTTNSFRISASGTLEIGSSNTAILTQSRNLQNIASISVPSITNTSGISILPAGSTHVTMFNNHNSESQLRLYNNRQDASNVAVSSVVGYNNVQVAKMVFYRGGGGNSGFIRFQYKPTNESSLTDVFQVGNGSTANYGVDVLAGGYRVSGTTAIDGSRNITSRSIVAEGNGTTSSTNALKVTKSGGQSTFTVRDDGVVLVQSNYLYVNNSAGFYSTGAIRARGGITNDGGNALSISSGAAHIAFNSKNFASVGTISSGQITSSGSVTAGDASSSLGFYVGTTQVITGTRNLVSIGTVGCGTITSTGSVSAATNIGVANTGSTSKYGISLYGGPSTNPTYGIMFTGTAGSGTHGSVTADWATYFTMNSTSGRGWIFRDKSTPTNVASISNAGHASFNGNVTAYASDKRLKTNIKPIARPLEKLMKLRGVEFDWIDGVEETHGFKPKCKHETGVIAQEVEQVIPDAISPAPFNNEYKTVEHTKIISLLIESVRSQQETIESLTKRIEELENGDN